MKARTAAQRSRCRARRCNGLGDALRSAALTIVLVGPGLAHAEVLDVSARGFTLENVRVVAAEPEHIWRALVEDVDRWWPRDHTWWGEASRLTLDPHAGGCFCEIAGERQARHLVTVFADPPRLLRMEGGLGPLQGMGLHGVLEWRIAPGDRGQGTRVALFYRAGGYTPDHFGELAPIVDQVQAQQLGGLADFVTRPQDRTRDP